MRWTKYVHGSTLMLLRELLMCINIFTKGYTVKLFLLYTFSILKSCLPAYLSLIKAAHQTVRDNFHCQFSCLLSHTNKWTSVFVSIVSFHFHCLILINGPRYLYKFWNYSQLTLNTYVKARAEWRDCIHQQTTRPRFQQPTLPAGQ